MQFRLLIPTILLFGAIHSSTADAQTQYAASSSAFAGVTFVVAAEPAERIDSASIPLRLMLPLPDDQQAVAPQRPMAVEYSDAYRTRAKIHKYASLATLPLFAAEGFVGQSLYNNPTDGKRSAHLAIASGMGALFAVNAVTGVWNLLEARKDANGRTRRVVHSVLMLAASAGFAATAATGPENEGRENGLPSTTEGSPGAHRAIAFTSIGLAATAYLIMLLGR